MASKRFRLRPGTQLLFMLIGFTFAVWVLRGLTILSWMPGLVLWLLILACIAVFIINGLQSAR